MTYPEKRKYILDKLRKNIRVGVEYDGYETGMSPGDYFDANAAVDSLSSFGEIAERARSFQSGQPDLSRKMSEQIAEIDKMLSDYADRLAKNAEIGGVDVASVKEEVFRKQARAFESRNKGKLVITSPDFFIG